MKVLYPGIILSVFLIPLLFSCTVTRPSYLFKELKRDTVIASARPNEQLKIKATDILSINISSLSKEEDALFSLNGISSGKDAASPGSGYSIDKEGNIHLHKLGKIKAEGLTRSELKENLEKALVPYLKDPVVTVSFANHFVTLMGEVGQPQLLNLPAENVSILDALALSSHATVNAQLNDLIVIRDKGEGMKEVKHLNLEDHSIFNSSWYYLQPNDVVVVNPDEKRMIEESKKTNYQRTTGLVLQAITIAVVLYQAFFKN